LIEGISDEMPFFFLGLIALQVLKDVIRAKVWFELALTTAIPE